MNHSPDDLTLSSCLSLASSHSPLFRFLWQMSAGRLSPDSQIPANLASFFIRQARGALAGAFGCVACGSPAAVLLCGMLGITSAAAAGPAEGMCACSVNIDFTTSLSPVSSRDRSAGWGGFVHIVCRTQRTPGDLFTSDPQTWRSSPVFRQL